MTVFINWSTRQYCKCILFYKIQNVFMYYAGYNKSIMNVHNKNAFVANIVIWLLGTSFRLRRLYAWNISTCVPSSSINIFFFSALSGVEELEMGPSTRYCGDLWTPFNLIPCTCDNSGLVMIWLYDFIMQQKGKGKIFLIFLGSITVSIVCLYVEARYQWLFIAMYTLYIFC